MYTPKVTTAIAFLLFGIAKIYHNPQFSSRLLLVSFLIASLSAGLLFFFLVSYESKKLF